MIARSLFFAGALVFAAAPSAVLVSAHASAARQSQQTAPSRLLPLQGGHNFRDLGGYRTRDGRKVRWRVLFRSGSMSGLTAADFAHLGKLGIRSVCDLRSTEERNAAPVRWPGNVVPKVLADDYKMDMAGLDLRDAAHWTGEQAHLAMASTYPRLLKNFNGQYRRMFRQLVAGNAPLAFNCSAGKDRTGIAAALILTALDVPRETVIADYLLSNRYLDTGKAMAGSDATFRAWKQLPQPVLQAFVGVDRRYIEAVFRVIDGHPGGARGYLRDELGLSQADFAALRSRYTTR